ncbi:hypothetical protein NOVA_21940 [Nocardia nova]|uniref:hypothetical protein n=1 Tax=Nocardia nova TaxID=37330 RepID=UPI001C43DD3E|nr:hypothetical protein [Nocardia nova]MBV7705445.1 hypothetical protein [Nocardia nova]
MASARQREAGESASGTGKTNSSRRPASQVGQEAASLGRSHVVRVRLRDNEVRALEQAMQTLDLASTSDALREGLRLLAKEAAEVGVAVEIREFYRDQPTPLPEGVAEPTDSELAAADYVQW